MLNKAPVPAGPREPNVLPARHTRKLTCWVELNGSGVPRMSYGLGLDRMVRSVVAAAAREDEARP
jgi:hypothetical protein